MLLTIFSLLAVQLLFGALPVASKIALNFAHPTEMILARNLGSFMVFRGLIKLMNRTRSQEDNVPVFSRSEKRYIFAISLCGSSLNQYLLFLGLQSTSAIVAAVVVPTIPFFTLILATALRHEVFNLPKLLICLIGLAGVAILLLPNSTESSLQGHGWGSLLCTASSVLSAAFLVFSREIVKQHGALRVLCQSYGYGVLVSALLLAGSAFQQDFIPFFSWMGVGSSNRAPSGDFWFAVLFIVFGSTALSNFLNMWAIKRVRASTVSGFVFLQTLIGTALGVWVLGESITWNTIVASFFIGTALVGLTRIALKEVQNRKEPA